MSETESKDISEIPRQSTEPPNTLDFSYLTEHPSVQGWKLKILSLIHGKGGEILSRLGSIEQYIRVLRHESKDRSVAEYCFSEAFSDVVQEWTPSLAEPADRLFNYLSLIAAFTPRVGFGKTLSYLQKTDGAKRTGEFIQSGQRTIDLYKKGLIAIGRYYPAPPAYSSEDQGFQSYKEILVWNLRDPQYSAYAALRLLELGQLPTHSLEFVDLVLQSDEICSTFLRYLVEALEKPRYQSTANEVLRDTVLAFARAHQIERFDQITRTLGVRFNSKGDYKVVFPTLTLSNGMQLDISLGLEEIQGTDLRKFAGYDIETLTDLITREHPNREKIERYASAYITQALNSSEIGAVLDHLTSLKISLSLSGEGFVLVPNGSLLYPNLPSEMVLDLEPNTMGQLLERKWGIQKNRTFGSVLKTARSRAAANNSYAPISH
jgi:hypothetical protein